ncbi:sulfotransferase family protein [Maribellus mangrovi]|uniref:sulfotransferase family protein n=1 Tax=Maribellus mangrovi TaxID=3133146 RepID=UPI0030ECCE2E
MKSPIFIFSLPRSGSTLLQRVLMTHPQIASVAEPWLLLPFLFSTKSSGIASLYNHTKSSSGLNSFINNLPNSKQDYITELRTFIFNLYDKQCKNGELFFLDKTPRYYLIIPEIAELFPNAKFIFLFRNPIHVMSSIMETWSNKSFKRLHEYAIDLYDGPQLLSDGYKLLKNKSIALTYESFVENPEASVKRICNYLEIDYLLDMTTNFESQNTKGKMGDPTGAKKYKKIEKESLRKWENILNTKFRISVAKKYINQLENQTFEIQGYNKEHILNELSQVKTSFQLPIEDMLQYQRTKLINRFHLNTWMYSKISNWSKGKLLS